MGFIVIIPAIVALYWSVRFSPARALVDVYLPVLLLLPEYYRWVLPGLPDPTFSQATILPIVAVALPGMLFGWKFSFTDLLIFGFAGCVAWSEYVNAGFNEAQNLMFDMLASVVLPYAVAKCLIETQRIRVAFARRFAFLIFLVAVIGIYEFRFGRTPWQIIFNPFFPYQGDGWVTTFRYGFARVAGPYGHAILGCLILVVGYRLQRWLEWGGYWEPEFRGLPASLNASLRRLKLTKARILSLGILMGIAMTLVRGPWLGALAGIVLVMVGRARDHKRALIVLACVLLLVGVPAGAWFYSYASVGRAAAKTDSQETAAYRKELIDKYIDVVLKKSALGWGRNEWPRVEGMPSIDNYYLLLALMHGLIADGFLFLIFITMIWRLVRFEMRGPPSAARRNSLGFTLAAVFVGIAVTIATVYMGLTVTPVFALLTGWSEGYLLNRRAGEVGIATPVVVPDRAFAFRRIVA
jgi:hypothetical protein